MTRLLGLDELCLRREMVLNYGTCCYTRTWVGPWLHADEDFLRVAGTPLSGVSIASIGAGISMPALRGACAPRRLLLYRSPQPLWTEL